MSRLRRSTKQCPLQAHRVSGRVLDRLELRCATIGFWQKSRQSVSFDGESRSPGPYPALWCVHKRHETERHPTLAERCGQDPAPRLRHSSGCGSTAGASRQPWAINRVACQRRCCSICGPSRTCFGKSQTGRSSSSSRPARGWPPLILSESRSSGAY